MGAAAPRWCNHEPPPIPRRAACGPQQHSNPAEGRHNQCSHVSCRRFGLLCASSLTAVTFSVAASTSAPTIYTFSGGGTISAASTPGCCETPTTSSASSASSAPPGSKATISTSSILVPSFPIDVCSVQIANKLSSYHGYPLPTNRFPLGDVAGEESWPLLRFRSQHQLRNQPKCQLQY